MAPVDSLADISCVSLETSKLLRCKILSLPVGAAPRLKLAGKDMFVNRIGRVRLNIRAGEQDITHFFEVLDCDFPMILGLDIMPRLGFYVGGVPTSWPGPRAGTSQAAEARTAEENLFQRDSPWCLEHQCPPEEIKLLNAVLEPRLLANAAIDPALPACPTISEANLHLPMDDSTLEGSKTFRRQYDIHNAAKPALRKAMAKWESQHCFEPADPGTDFNSPLMAAGKKDADGLKTDWRICFDTRHINALLSREGFANGRIPRIEELLRRLSGFTHASCLDLSSAYQQLPIAPEDRHKTAFTYEGRHLQWQRWPFGLSPATPQFQKVMEIVLEGIEGVVIYVDDVAVVTNGSIEDHAKVVAQVIDRLNEHRLRLNIDKCHFGFRRITMLGHSVTGDSQSIDATKVNQAIDWPEPTSGKDVMRFLGFANFLRGYIPDYARIAQPLDGLRSAGRKLQLNDHQREAFQTMKAAINKAPCLSTPLPNVQFQLATDASQSGLGAVLYQEVDGVRRYVGFASKALNGAQRNYPATKRELLAVVYALRAFSHYLFGEKFILYTDHQALTSIFTINTVSYVIANWLDVLLEYDFEIRHRPGIEMVIPDSLSRLYESTLENEGVRESPALNCIMLEQEAIRACQTLQAQSPTLCPLSVAEPPAKRPNLELDEFIKERFDKKTVSSHEDQVKMLRSAHAFSHFGAEHLFKQVWDKGYFWNGMRRMCDEIVGTCHTCLQYNVRRKGFNPTRSLRADAPWDHIAIDCAVDLPVSKSGNSAILILVDVATRFVVAKPLPNTQEATVARALFEVFTTFGPPKAMQSDQGKEFTNRLLAKLSKAAGIDHRFVAAYNPQANGLAERSVRTIKESLKKRLSGSFDRWDEALPGTIFAINTKDHKLTKTAPFTLFFGRGVAAWEDYSTQQLIFSDYEKQASKSAKEWVELQPEEVQRISKNNAEFIKHVRNPLQKGSNDRQDEQNAQLDKKRKLIDTRIRPGCLVYLQDRKKTSKLEASFVGPFLVHRQSKRSLTFFLDNLQGTRLPRSFTAQELIFVRDTNLPIATAQGDDMDLTAPQGSIKNILLDRPAEDGSTEYLVTWRDSGEQEWVPASSFSAAGDLANYHRHAKPFKKRKDAASTPLPRRDQPRRAVKRNAKA